MDSHAAQESIDKQISAHESVIRDLRTLRNTHAGISKLPIKVLSEIFLLAKLSSSTHLESCEKRGWLNVAGVCRNWRQITLNAPRMWDTLNTSKLNSLGWAETLIARSKNVPLHVSCTYPHRATPRAVLDLVFSHIARIQDLDIILSTSLNAKIQDIIDLQPLCVLQSLSLNNQDLLFSDGNGGIDSFLSEAQMPYLRALDLRHFELPHTISVLPQLRHLYYAPPIGPSRTTISGILSFLRNTPSLEWLEINAPLRPSENGGMETATVELTKLSFLSYTTPEFSDVSLFRFLRYPPSSRVLFLSYMPPTDTVACADDLASILTHAASSDAAAATEVSLAAMDGVYFDMQVSGPDGLMLEMNFPIAKGDLLTLLKLPVMLPCYGARTLLIRGFHSVTVADWANIFTRHSQVQHLTVEDVDSNFFRALLKPTENEPPPFTHLKSLLLSHCDIGEHMALVKRVLEEHRQLDADIGVTIKIERCRVARDSIRELEACAKVGWDGIEEFVVDSEEEYERGNESDDDDDDELVFISTA